jgi:hypothetical protein
MVVGGQIMKAMRTSLQIIGILLLIPAVAMATLRFENRNDDGPSILFPGGELVSGELYSGPEPNWDFTSDIQTIELELEDTGSSRLIWILNADGNAYVVSGYMNTFLGRLWKDWAVVADEGSGEAVIRIDGVRYERQLQRIRSGDELDGVAESLLRKYTGAQVTPEAIANSRAAIESGSTWAFRLAPRSE